MTRPATLGELRASGWVSRPIKDEIRANTARRSRTGDPLVEGVIGYDDTVVPQLANALLAGHDIVFLGERGQAKTRIMRGARRAARRVDADRRGQRDQRRPVPPGVVARARCSSRSAATRRRSSGSTATAASARSSRRPTRRSPTSSARSTRSRSPRAATSPTSSPSTTGSCRAPTAASSRSTSSPTSPSASRSACSTCSRNATCRSAATRSACRSTCCWSRRRTPRTTRTAAASSRRSRTGSARRSARTTRSRPSSRSRSSHQEARPLEAEELQVTVPEFMTEIVAEISQHARQSPHVNQRSGVSARLSIANYETLVANAARRALANQEREVVPRVLRPRRAGGVDLGQDRDRDARRRPRLAGARPHHQGRGARGVPGAREAGAARPDRLVVRGRLGRPHRRRRARGRLPKLVDQIEGLKPLLAKLGIGESPAACASGVEFVLEGLHLTKRLNKDAVGSRATYRSGNQRRSRGPGRRRRQDECESDLGNGPGWAVAYGYNLTLT